MASKNKFVSDFRGAIEQMLDSYDRVMALSAQYKAMGWMEADFVDAIGSNDISAAEFNQAVQACAGLTDGFASLATILAKMRS